jgi:PadR family transcriptional regulator AphA
VPGPQEKLSLTEWLVLCLVSEQPTHGFAVARLLGRDGSMGQVWRVPKPVVYRALQRLEQLALIEAAGEEPTSLGPVPCRHHACRAGGRGGLADAPGSARQGRAF